MYYEESLNLIDAGPLDKDAIKRLDRVIAGSYDGNHHGVIDRAWVQHLSEVDEPDFSRLLNDFVSAGIISRRDEVECPCGQVFDPSDMVCLECGISTDEAETIVSNNFIVNKQPQMPSFDPDAQPTNPTVFISYRQNDTKKLAADIYYSLKAEGHSVFIDNGEIPAGANAEQVFLRAASKASHFISLVSPNYFESPYCKKEIAHAARKKRRILRVNVEPVPDAPNDMTWANAANWVKTKGVATGLSPDLEAELLHDVRIQPSANVVDLRLSACEFLLNQIPPQELTRVWNHMGLHQTFMNMPDSKQEAITRILQESNPGKLDQLCDALAV